MAVIRVHAGNHASPQHGQVSRRAPTHRVRISDHREHLDRSIVNTGIGIVNSQIGIVNT